MFRIGEFSKLMQVSIRMLRYYDEINLLKPAETDPQTGYRMYSADQIPLLNKIIYLRDSGFHISEIAEILQREDEESVVWQLDKKYAEIEMAIEEEKEKLRKLCIAKKELQQGKNEMHYNVSIKSIPGYPVLSLRKVVPDYYAEGEMWKELSTFVAAHQVPVLEQSFSIYHDAEYKETDVDIEVCVSVEKKGEGFGNFTYRDTEPVPEMACTMVYGDFSNIAEAYRSFAQWLQENRQYKMIGESRQIVHRGPWNEENPQNYLTEIQIPLE